MSCGRGAKRRETRDEKRRNEERERERT